MPHQYRSRVSSYVRGFFPEAFRVDVWVALNDDYPLSITITTPEGVSAVYDTTAAQALDIVAMGDIAEQLKRRVGFPDYTAPESHTEALA